MMRGTDRHRDKLTDKDTSKYRHNKTSIKEIKDKTIHYNFILDGQ